MSRPLLEFDPSQEPVLPKAAATVVIARDSATGPEVFCVERNQKSRFLGGAIVFPGGKVDPFDRDDVWTNLVTAPRVIPSDVTRDADEHRALAVAALRETVEEAGLLFVDGAVTEEDIVGIRTKLAVEPRALAEFLVERRLRLDAQRLYPFARWVTPAAETRRFDAVFFLARAPEGQAGGHDRHETTASFWARPHEVLARFDRGELQVAPPTHRTLEVLASASNVAEMLALADGATLLPICPKLVAQKEGEQDVLALVLPGDPLHDVPEPRVAGGTRYVLRGELWKSE